MKTCGLLFYVLGGQKSRNGEDWESGVGGWYCSSSQFSPLEIIFLEAPIDQSKCPKQALVTKAP